jgi:hypothetical protein
MPPNNEQQLEPVTTQEPTITTDTPSVSEPTGLTVQPPPKQSLLEKLKAKWKLLALISGGIVVLLGASAAGYYGVVVPNKPENVLKSAISNTLHEQQIPSKGTFEIESTTGSTFQFGAVTVTFDGQTNMEKKAFSSHAEAAISGVKFPVDVRYVDSNAYFKIGDLSTIKSLTTSLSPEIGQMVDAFSQKVSNKWIEVDRSLIKEAKLDCALDVWTLSDDDINLLLDTYETNSFATIKSTANEKVDGKDAIKYELSIDDNGGAEYVKKLDNLSVIKKLKECSGDNNAINTKELADGDTTLLTIWVNKSTKRISKIASQTTAQDEQKDHIKGKFEATLSYDKVDITKPDGATPLMQLYGELLQSFGPQTGGNGTYFGNDILTQTLGAFDIRE